MSEILIDYPTLWDFVVECSHPRSPHSVHGPDHWLRVERNACILAAKTDAVIEVARLFALFHDSQRIHDGTDPEHGSRGAAFARKLRGVHFNLPDDHFDLLDHACCHHTDGSVHSDPTIGACWDADRLDLGRVGVIPDPQFMSTELGREMARFGSVQPWLDWAAPFLEDPATHHQRYG